MEALRENHFIRKIPAHFLATLDRLPPQIHRCFWVAIDNYVEEKWGALDQITDLSLRIGPHMVFINNNGASAFKGYYSSGPNKCRTNEISLELVYCIPNREPKSTYTVDVSPIKIDPVTYGLLLADLIELMENPICDPFIESDDPPPSVVNIDLGKKKPDSHGYLRKMLAYVLKS